MKNEKLKTKLQELIKILDSERCSTMSYQLQPLFYGLYAKHYEMEAVYFYNKTIRDIFVLCKENAVEAKDLLPLFQEGLTPIKNSEIERNYDKCYHRKLKIQITRENVDDYDYRDFFNPFDELRLLEGGARICKELAEKYGDESVWCEDKEMLSTYNKVSDNRFKKLKKFKEEYASILNKEE